MFLSASVHFQHHFHYFYSFVSLSAFCYFEHTFDFVGQMYQAFVNGAQTLVKGAVRVASRCFSTSGAVPAAAPPIDSSNAPRGFMGKTMTCTFITTMKIWEAF